MLLSSNYILLNAHLLPPVKNKFLDPKFTQTHICSQLIELDLNPVQCFLCHQNEKLWNVLHLFRHVGALVRVNANKTLMLAPHLSDPGAPSARLAFALHIFHVA